MSACCDRNVRREHDMFRCRDGEHWTCGGCGLSYEHVCDEAEGCYWALLDEEIAPEDMPAAVALTEDGET